MVIYIETANLDGGCCFIGNIKNLLNEKGYTIHTSRGKYLKVDTGNKAVFGCADKVMGCKTFNSRSSWFEIKDAL